MTDGTVNRRQRNIAVLAQSSFADLCKAVEDLGSLPEAIDLRKPEIGMIMLRARVGGDGQPFNCGEATVARSVVRLLHSGEVGFGYRLGRDIRAARLSAVLDALGQSAEWQERIEHRIIEPLAGKQAERKASTIAQTSATRVEFFTMTRGED